MNGFSIRPCAARATIRAARQWLAPALAALACCSAASAAQVSLLTASTTVQVGAAVEVRVQMSGLSAAAGDSLSAYDFGIAFDASSLSFTGFNLIDSASGQNQLDFTEAGSFGFLGDVTSTGTGTLSAFGLSGNSAAVLDLQQADQFDVLRLFFIANTVASAAQILLNLGVSSSPFVDSGSGLLAVTPAATSLALNIVNASGGTVPEPTTLALGVLALCVAGASRRRMRRAPLLAALALPLAALPALAAQPAAPPAAAQAAAPAPLGVVVEAVGQRFKVRDASGAMRWYTARAPLPAQIVNKRVSGVPRPMGDAVAVDQIRFD